MNESVKDSNGQPAPKYKIASRALVEIAHQIQAFTTNAPGGTPRTVEAGLFVFNARGAKQAVPFGPFNATSFETWAASFDKPEGDTPLGNALVTAAAVLRHSPQPRKHLLVITDGMNTQGPDPSVTIPRIQKEGEKDHSAITFHFVAFDVAASQFAPLKKLGATVVGAADEKQLGVQLGFILHHQILLEEEEPAKH